MNKLLSSPLVSIGIPTYNRVDKLKRALESALNQDYQKLEIVISDNASTDHTEAYCRSIASSDDRVKYFRQHKNQGMTKNFTKVLFRSTGQFFMWLADDDWMCPGYVTAAVEILSNRPDVSIVYAGGKFYDNNDMIVDIESSKSISAEDIVERIIAYYDKVTYNGEFYGLMKRCELSNISLRDCVGADWLVIAAMLARGKSVALNRDFFLNRSADGISKNIISAAKNSNVFYSKMNNIQNIYFWISMEIFIDISIRCRSFKEINLFRRVALAICCAFIVFIRHSYLSTLKYSFRITKNLRWWSKSVDL